MKHRLPLVLSFLVATVATFEVASTREAAAFTQYTNTSARGRCTVMSGSNGTDWEIGGYIFNGNNSLSSFLNLSCTVIDSSALTRNQMAFISVDTFNNTNGLGTISAQACLQDNADTVYSCGANAVTSTQGHASLNPSIALWSGAGYPFLAVSLQSSSSLVGYSITN
jgi:hypothetical protein